MTDHLKDLQAKVRFTELSDALADPQGFLTGLLKYGISKRTTGKYRAAKELLADWKVATLFSDRLSVLAGMKPDIEPNDSERKDDLLRRAHAMLLNLDEGKYDHPNDNNVGGLTDWIRRYSALTGDDLRTAAQTLNPKVGE